MKKFLSALLVVLAGAVSGAPVTPYFTATPPVIDGKLDDPCWSRAQTIDDFVLFNDRARKPATRRTEVRIVYTETGIAAGFKAFIPADRLPDRDDVHTTISRTDCVEFMLTPSPGADSYLHFIINSFNRTFERVCDQGGYVGTAEWFCFYRTAVHKEKDFWSAELELPYSELGITDPAASVWRFNLVRESYNLPTAAQEISSITGAVNDGKTFRELTPPPVDLRPYALLFPAPACQAEMRDGKQLITARTAVENRTGEARKLQAEITFTPLAGGLPGRARSTVELAASGRTQLELPAAEIPMGGKYQGCFLLRDIPSHRVLARKYFDLTADFTPLAIELTDPHYRDAIFVTQKLDKVRGTVKLGASSGTPDRITVEVRPKGGAKALASKSFPVAETTAFEFDNAILPFGRLEIHAAVYDAGGKLLVESVKPFRKLEYKPWEMYLGKDGVWRRDGKRFFILGVWNSGPAQQYILPDFNLSVEEPPHPGQLRLNRIFFGKNLKLLREKGFCPEAAEAFEELLRKKIDDPNCMIHYLMDEPDCFGQSAENVSKLAAHLADVDPWRPLLISTASNGGTRYMNCGEINAFHCYPRTERHREMANFGKMGILLDQWHDAYRTAKPGFRQSILWLHQGFCYGDVGLRESRIPTYEEYRNQNLYALTVGAAGILQYNRCEEQFPELYVGLPALTRELKIVGNEAIIQPDAKEQPTVSDPNLRVLAKYNPETRSYWLLAVNGSDRAAEYTIDFAPFAERSVQVLSEDRTCKFEGGKLTERFTPWQARVYTSDMRDFHLPAIARIKETIEQEYAKRPKPGNLVYQRYENEGVKVFASSNRYKQEFNECSLWHLADGVTSGTVGDRPHGGGVVVSCDATPNRTPDWIEYEFLKPLKIGRVVVYPAQDSIKDCTIEIERDGKFVPVASVKDARGAAQTLTFPPETTSRMRLVVTANRGKYTRLFEIEVYEQ